MKAEQLTKLRNKTPFVPFTIHTSDQRLFEIPHPDYLWVLPGGKTIGVSDREGIADIIDLLHVVSVKGSGIAAE